MRPPRDNLIRLPDKWDRVVGLDLSLVSTGVANIKQGAFSALTLKTKERGVARLHDLSTRLRDLLCTDPPAAVAIEGYSFGSRSNQHSIGEWGGIAKLEVKRIGLPCIIVPPSCLKKFITGKGNADPSSISMYLLKHWGVEVPQNDMADAVGLAIMAFAWKFHSEVALTQYQEEALAKVEVLA